MKDWWSVDDVKVPETQQEYVKPKKELPQNFRIDMNEILAKFQPIELDKNLIKYMISEGENIDLKVNLNCKIRVTYEERNHFGELIDPSRNLSQAIVISMATSHPIIQGLKLAFLSMSQNEEAWFKMSDELLFFESDLKNLQNPPKMSKYYKIKIEQIHYHQVQNLSNMEGQSIFLYLQINFFFYNRRIQQLNRFREDGNSLFQRDMFRQAITRYQKGLNFLDKWPKSLENQQYYKMKQEFSIIFTGNIAQSLMELEDYTESARILETIIGLTRNTKYEQKNYYRLIKSLINIGELEKAQKHMNEMKYLINTEINPDFMNLDQRLRISF